MSDPRNEATPPWIRKNMSIPFATDTRLMASVRDDRGKMTRDSLESAFSIRPPVRHLNVPVNCKLTRNGSIRSGLFFISCPLA